MRKLRALIPLLWIAGAAAVAFGLQFGAAPVLHCRFFPELTACLVITVSLSLGPYWGITAALILGAAADALTGPGLGPHMLSYSLAAGLASMSGFRARAEQPWTAPALALGEVLTLRVIALVTAYISRVGASVSGAWIGWLLLTCLTTAVAAFLTHLILYPHMDTGRAASALRRKSR